MLNYNTLPDNDLDYLAVCALEDLPNGERLFIEVDEHVIIVFNIAGGLFAIADVCSHDDGSLDDAEVEGHEVICPRHGARFDIRNGAATSLPAIQAIPAYPVRVMGGMVEVGVPR